tara:strand:+ start:668 stop:1093 length:426 start_codon:yes stop_codon:yes gene_type:complete
MKHTKKKIGWQKYEDLIEKQMSSPLLKTIIQQMAVYAEEDDEEESEDYEEMEAYKQSNVAGNMPILPISKELMDDMAMLSNFDCWIGHTNFDITKEIKSILNKTEGVELLKVLSRYRFFVGIGKMFDFKEVRKKIENHIIT